MIKVSWGCSISGVLAEAARQPIHYQYQASFRRRPRAVPGGNQDEKSKKAVFSSSFHYEVLLV